MGFDSSILFAGSNAWARARSIRNCKYRWVGTPARSKNRNLDLNRTGSGPEMDQLLLNLSVGKVVVPFVKSFGIQRSHYAHWIYLRMRFSQQPCKGLYQGLTGRLKRQSITHRLVGPWPWYLSSRASWKCETHRSVIFNLISSKLVNSPTALPSKSKSWMVTFIRLAGFSHRSMYNILLA